MDIEKTIREYLPNIIHMSVASCADNKPYVWEVHYVYDDDLNFYFRSKPDRRHSIEVEKNPTVAGNIVTQHGLEDAVQGVYFEGRCEKLEIVDELSPAYTRYCERFGTGPDILAEATEDTGHGFYKISVDTFYVFDGRESEPAQKYELKWGK